MNPIEQIEREVRHQLPETRTRIRKPRRADGVWFLDVDHDDHTVNIEWQPDRGIGVSAGLFEDGYGEGPDETFVDIAAATRRVVQLLKSKEHSNPPPQVFLRELRARQGVTQADMARMLGIQQAAVSKFERRDDITLSSLQRFVSALDAELEIHVKTRSGESLRLVLPHGNTTERAHCEHVAVARSVVPSFELATETPKRSADRKTVGAYAERDRESVDHRASVTLSRWVEAFAESARARWPLTCDRLHVAASNRGEVAQIDTSTGRIHVNTSAAREWTEVMISQESDTGFRWRSTEHTYSSILRVLLAHEVGHCVDASSLQRESWARPIRGRELYADAVAGWLLASDDDDDVVGLLGASFLSRLGCTTDACGHAYPEERSASFLSGYYQGRFEAEKRRRAPQWRSDARSTTCREASARRMKLCVIRASEPERSRDFYERLGLSFQEEVHGTGPVHYACELGDMVFEIYPATSRKTSLRLGFDTRVTAEDIRLSAVLGPRESAPRFVSGTDGNQRCVLRDPDGNSVEVLVDGPV